MLSDLYSMSGDHYYTVATNPALTPSGGVCTWTPISVTPFEGAIVSIYEVSTGNQVLADVSTSSGIVISFISSTTIPAGTYKAVITELHDAS